MSFLIEQTRAEAQDAFTFSRRAEIAGIRLASGTFENRLRAEDKQKNLDVTFRLTPGERKIIETTFQASTDFECAIVQPAEDAGEPLIRMQCILVATYDLHEGYTPTEAEINAFHKANVTFNAWPFFREFVQASACRMGVPVPPVPFVRVQVIAEPKEPLALETSEQ